MNKPYKILMVAHNAVPHAHSGVEIYAHTLAQALTQAGLDVHSLYPRCVDDHPEGFIDSFRSDHATCHEVYVGTPKVRMNLVWNQTIRPQVMALFKREQFDRVLLLHVKDISGTVADVAHRFGLPVDFIAFDSWLGCDQIYMIDQHGQSCPGPKSIDQCVQCYIERGAPIKGSEATAQLFFYMAFRQHKHKELFQRFNRVSFPSQWLKNRFADCGLIHPNSHLHREGIAPLESPVASLEDVKTPLRLALISNLVPLKGIDIPLKALALKKNLPIQLTVYGKALDKNYTQELEGLSASDPRVTFYGGFDASQKSKILENNHAVLFPTLVENYPLTIRESLLAGRPVMASQTGGIPEMAEHYQGITLVEPGNVQAWADALERWCQNPELILEQARNIKTPLSMDEHAQDLIKQWSNPASSPLTTWQRNIKALYQSNPSVADWIVTLNDEDKTQNYEVNDRKALVSGASVHNLEHPEEEAQHMAQQWFKQVPPGSPVCVMGFGLGFHLEALLKMMGPDQVLQVQMLDRVLFQLAMEHRDLSHILGDQRLSFVSDLIPQRAFVLPSFSIRS